MNYLKTNTVNYNKLADKLNSLRTYFSGDPSVCVSNTEGISRIFLRPKYIHIQGVYRGFVVKQEKLVTAESAYYIREICGEDAEVLPDCDVEWSKEEQQKFLDALEGLFD